MKHYRDWNGKLNTMMNDLPSIRACLNKVDTKGTEVHLTEKIIESVHVVYGGSVYFSGCNEFIE